MKYIAMKKMRATQMKSVPKMPCPGCGKGAKKPPKKI